MIDSNEYEDALDAPRVSWCATCDGPCELDESGRCVSCAESGDPDDVEEVVPEPLPLTSPRAIECALCGADIGEHCHPSEEGGGYNHASRVRAHEDDREVLAARHGRRR